MTKRKASRRLYEGLPVVDANVPLQMQITSTDVKHAKKGSPTDCAAALACKREYKTEVRIFLTRAYVKHDKKWVRYIVPESITREIISFDRGSQFEPGKYKLNAAGPTTKLGNYRAQGSGKSGRTANKKTIKKTAHVREFDKAGIYGGKK